jgi:hypothetical protein
LLGKLQPRFAWYKLQAWFSKMKKEYIFHIAFSDFPKRDVSFHEEPTGLQLVARSLQPLFTPCTKGHP